MQVGLRTFTIWPEADDPAPPGDPGYWRFLDVLVDGRLRLGTTITQDELCRILGMTLSPLRETVTLLVADGLVTVRRRVGVTIFYPDVAFVRSTFQLRGLIEREGLRKFAELVPGEWLDEMMAAHGEAMALVAASPHVGAHEPTVKRLEHSFHGSFVAAFQNPYIEDVYGRLLRKLYLLRLMYPASVNARATTQALDEHLAIIEALRAGNAQKATGALDRHLAAVIHRVLGIRAGPSGSGWDVLLERSKPRQA